MCPRAGGERLMFDPQKPIKTRRGRPARILGRVANPPFSLVVAVMEDEDGRETIETYRENGRYLTMGESSWDLVNEELG